MLASAGVGATESGLDYGESILRPSLNLTQLLYGGAGGQRNAIDPEATAGFDLRLVPGMTVAGSRAAIEAHVRGQGYVLLDAPPTAEERAANPRLARFDWGDDGYPAAMSSPDDPGVARVMAVMKAATDDAVRIAPLMGGSLPIAPIGEVLGTPFVIVPIVNADNNQHAPNENLRMKEFRPRHRPVRGTACGVWQGRFERTEPIYDGASAASASPIQLRNTATSGSSSRFSCQARKYAPAVIVSRKGRINRPLATCACANRGVRRPAPSPASTASRIRCWLRTRSWPRRGRPGGRTPAARNQSSQASSGMRGRRARPSIVSFSRFPHEIAGHVRRQLERKQGHRPDVRPRSGAMADRDVETAVVERPVFICDVECERDAGVVAAKLRQPRQEPERCEGDCRRERQESRTLQFLQRPLDRGKALREAWREAYSRLSQPQSRPPHEKPRAEPLLELRDSLAHGGLREPELFRRGGEAPALGAGGEDPKRFPVLAGSGGWHKRGL